MKKISVALLALVMILVTGNHALAHILEKPPGPIKHEFSEPLEVIAIYYKAVERGELILFGMKIDKSMLMPVRVEYVYELNSAIPQVKVYSDLKQPMPMPGQDKCMIRGVSTILDDDGHISEVVAHVWPE